MAQTFAVTISTEAITAQFDDGQDYAWPKDHPNFNEVKDALKRGTTANELLALMDTVTRVQEKLAPVAASVGLTVSRDGVFWRGKPLHMTISDRIVEFMKEDLPVQPLVNFLEHLLMNQRRSAVMSLFDFLEANKIPITEDGHFLAYKRVRSTYMDIHSGSFDNTPGKRVSIDPWEVDENRDRECSNGLHVCARHYLPSFGSQGSGDKIVICKVSPAHVVAVPRDYNNSKMRVFEYEVIGELTDEQKASVLDGINLVRPGTVQDSAFSWAYNFQPTETATQSAEEEADPAEDEDEDDYYDDNDYYSDEDYAEYNDEEDSVEQETPAPEPTESPAETPAPSTRRWWFR